MRYYRIIQLYYKDWLFVIIVSAIGLVVMLNTFRMKNWISSIIAGKSYFLYDFCIIYLFCFIYWVIPNVLTNLRIKHGYQDGTQYMLMIYPLLDLSMEIVLDSVLDICDFAQLYIYQAQLLLIGCRLGIFLLSSWEFFEFWFCLLLLMFFRLNNSSMLITVFLRRQIIDYLISRQIYYKSPTFLKPLCSMDENSLTLKGKHGAYYEHFVWIVFFYLFYISEMQISFYVKGDIIISSCDFKSNIWPNIRYWYLPIIIWILFIIAEYLAYLINKEKRYDNIKWLGGCNFNMIENILIRCLGYYFFTQALMVSQILITMQDPDNGIEYFRLRQNVDYLTGLK